MEIISVARLKDNLNWAIKIIVAQLVKIIFVAQQLLPGHRALHTGQHLGQASHLNIYSWNFGSKILN